MNAAHNPKPKSNATTRMKDYRSLRGEGTHGAPQQRQYKVQTGHLNPGEPPQPLQRLIDEHSKDGWEVDHLSGYAEGPQKVGYLILFKK
jgi:hypothetical protein